MKKSFFLIFCIVSFNAIGQTGIKFNHSAWAEIINQAKKEKKLIFMDAYTSWCGPCKMMSAKVFVDKDLGDYFNSNFVNAKIDMEEGEGPIISTKFPVRGYPTLLFIDPNNEKIVNQALGYRSVQDLKLLAEQTLSNKKK